MTNQSLGSWSITTKGMTHSVDRAAHKTGTSLVTAGYAQILAEKIASIEDDLKRMEKEREDIEEIDTLRRDAEKRGTFRLSEEVPETVKRVMGDGTILVTTTEGGRIVEQYRKKPRLVPVPNDAAPQDAPSSDKVKWVPRQNPLDLLEFA